MRPLPPSLGITLNRSSGRSGVRSVGMTLMEMTVVILVLLLIIGVIFIGARAWLRGSARTTCIMNISLVQRTVRGYSNLHNYAPGAASPNLLAQIIGSNRFIQNVPICPAEGVYTYGEDFGVNTIPPMGAVYMKCSLATDLDHVPEVSPEW